MAAPVIEDKTHLCSLRYLMLAILTATFNRGKIFLQSNTFHVLFHIQGKHVLLFVTLSTAWINSSSVSLRYVYQL